MAGTIKIRRPGVVEMLKSPQVRKEISSLAEAIASEVRNDEPILRHQAEVKVEEYTTDRAASAILIKHPVGMGIQAKYGTLTRAASSAGLQVRTKK
jgi:hypothetical protein